MSTDKTIQAKQAAMEALQKINAVEGFDPSALAVEYADLNSSGGGDKRLRLPVMAQIGWFRLKYPEGRIAVSVVTGKDCFVATALFRSCGAVSGRGHGIQRLSAR